MMKQNSHTAVKYAELLTHIIGWGIVFCFPVFFLNKGGGPIDWRDYFRHCGVPLSFFIAFYVNYFGFIPKMLFHGQTKRFLITTILFVVGLSILLSVWQNINMPPPKRPHGDMPPDWLFFARDLLSMVLTIGLACSIRLIGRWGQIESEKQEAEKDRTESELKNLRNQLNPHFLLNTLNNIYALIAFDADKAQEAVQELSKLLRHLLYDNQQQFVSLAKEMDFIYNYIELMRIRLSGNVSVETHINIDKDTRTLIAPLIYISLIENAFKHGISSSAPSFISISFSESDELVECIISNSYHPKGNQDKSGSGIGLEQVRKRLELIYPGKYLWKKGVSEDGKIYTSKIIINTATQ